MTGKATKLQALYEKMLADTKLPLQTNLVFGEGSPEADIVFIGEAPGLNEDLQKRPFVGRSGKLLTASIEEIGLRREDVYITNIVKRRPPENRDPLPLEIEAYKPYLKEQLEIINPKMVVTLGRFSMNYFLPSAKITRDQGKIFCIGGSLLMPMFHPAAALRGTTALSEFKRTFKKLSLALKKYDKLVQEAGIADEKKVNL
jgi:DNA polymerase